jgi:hypothetical protein
MTHRARFTAWAACAVLLAGAAALPGANHRKPRVVPFEVIERGNDSALAGKGPALDLLPDEGGFGAFYAALHGNKIPPREPPKVDFRSNVVLYVSFGRKQTGGYRVEVLDALIHRRALVISAQLAEPPPNSYLIQMITNPYVLVSVPRAEAAGVRYDRVELRDRAGDIRFTLATKPG